MHPLWLGLTAVIGAAAANPVVEWPRNGYYYPKPSGYTSDTSDTYTATSDSSLTYPDSYPTTTTEVMTTYTTETVCPITKTHGTEVITTLTTSTITITSCKVGCHGHVPKPTEKPDYPYHPPGGDKPIVYQTTITTTLWTFVPCSTLVGQYGHSDAYSTYLTSSAIYKTYTTDVVVYPTEPADVPPVTYAVDCPVTYAVDCPAPTTVYSTVTVTVVPEHPSKCYDECVEKIYTVTDGDYTTVITVTDYPKPTETEDKHTDVPTGPGYSLPPYSTGKVPYPTYGGDYSSKDAPKPTETYYSGDY